MRKHQLSLSSFRFSNMLSHADLLFLTNLLYDFQYIFYHIKTYKPFKIFLSTWTLTFWEKIEWLIEQQKQITQAELSLFYVMIVILLHLIFYRVEL